MRGGHVGDSGQGERCDRRSHAPRRERECVDSAAAHSAASPPPRLEAHPLQYTTHLIHAAPSRLRSADPREARRQSPRHLATLTLSDSHTHTLSREFPSTLCRHWRAIKGQPNSPHRSLHHPVHRPYTLHPLTTNALPPLSQPYQVLLEENLYVADRLRVLQLAASNGTLLQQHVQQLHVPSRGHDAKRRRAAAVRAGVNLRRHRLHCQRHSAAHADAYESLVAA